ncbi:hypothetical protein KFE25_013926 [Diacronema lutheri]|uniref:Uncharacterized protein n=1 Tax=Diacronema lutheri TaxID=2081491 RepID=A0A8J5XDV3_DIALT|nr:hypothetical protein KFE25_013926 [Diacronema lutheri]
MHAMRTCTLIGCVAVAAGARPGARPLRRSPVSMNIFSSLFGARSYGGEAVMGDESIMAPKAHGTSATPVQQNLKWSCDRQVADRICNFNRHFAEYAGYWESTTFIEEASKAGGELTFYDSNTGKPLFVAPRGRTLEQFVKESRSHGWPSFRDNEVVWENVRVLPDGETVSVDGTHLGHDLPDGKGNRYCINLVCIAGSPQKA